MCIKNTLLQLDELKRTNCRKGSKLKKKVSTEERTTKKKTIKKQTRILKYK